MTRLEAMSEAVDIVEALSEGTPRPGTAPERTAAAIEVASFLLGFDEAEEVDEDGEAEEPGELPTPPGAVLFKVPCAVTPADFAEVTGYRTSASRVPMVKLVIVEGEDRNHIVVTPAVARQYAAGVLNAADEADGTTALTFTAP